MKYGLFKQLKLVTASLVCISIWFASVSIPAAFAQNHDRTAQEFLQTDITRLREQIAFYQQNEEETLQALNNARRILALSREKNNVKAERIAREGIAKADETLIRIRGYKKRDMMRLAAIEDALGWKHIDKAFGAPVIIKGEVFKRTKLGLVRYDGKSPALEGDTLVTGTDGFLEILFPDNTHLWLGNDTEVEVQKLNDRLKGSAYGFLSGKLHVAATCWKLYGPEKCRELLYKHHSSGITLSVRGTEFTVKQNPDKSLTLLVFEGVVEVTEQKTGVSFKINAGELATIGNDGIESIPLNKESIDRWWEEPTE